MSVKGINSTHQMSQTKIYKEWAHMKQRCFYEKDRMYYRYGARGITVCNEWKNSFEAFYKYVSKLPHYGEKCYSLDRINNDGNYEPGNVQWATAKAQIKNRSNAIIFNGKSLQEWSEELGIKYSTLYMRIYGYKWPLEKALRKG